MALGGFGLIIGSEEAFLSIGFPATISDGPCRADGFTGK